MLGVNHFGHFLLTRELLELVKKAKNARIINVSSTAHAKAREDFLEDLSAEKNYGLDTYRNSKLANVLFSLELQKRLEGEDVCVYSVHPGVVATQLIRDLSPWFEALLRTFLSFYLKDAEEGAKTQVMVASDPSLQNTCAKYWADCRVQEETAQAKDEKVAAKLWAKTEEMLEEKLSKIRE